MTANSLSSIVNGLHQLKKSNLMKDSMIVGLISQHLFYGITTSAVIQYIANPVIFQQLSKKQTIKRSLNYTEQLLPSEPADKTLDPQGEL